MRNENQGGQKKLSTQQGRQKCWSCFPLGLEVEFGAFEGRQVFGREFGCIVQTLQESRELIKEFQSVVFLVCASR